MTITSNHNQRLKEIRKLRTRRRVRGRSGRFVAEGEDLLAAADAAGWEPVERYCAAGSGLPGIEVEAGALAKASGLASGTRALAVYEERWAPSPLGPLCLYLHGLSDPGNVGTILRSAQAFGVSSVALGLGTADPYGLKAVRASMGAIFSVPVARAEAVNALPGVKIALVPGEGLSLPELMSLTFTPRAPETSGPETTLLIGSERDGLPGEVIGAADHFGHIPIRAQSLNAAMAATVALYELNRMAPPEP